MSETPKSLLRSPVQHISELGPCHCPPDKCQAPVIMGRRVACTRDAPKPAADTVIEPALREKLHRFLNEAAGEGFILDGVDAADLYIALFPAEYAAATKDL